ncbi:hypothetical protein E2C01_078229 [Portunus trituberculatus]|uniref:Uncharacterized protein n=1 Tax=Portunus trituberculatus TaxID=210409 RepID=A0A5B7IPM5_PORTR|nr:hypothetical protein [Portunus trituberculatus]
MRIIKSLQNTSISVNKRAFYYSEGRVLSVALTSRCLCGASQRDSCLDEIPASGRDAGDLFPFTRPSGPRREKEHAAVTRLVGVRVALWSTHYNGR